LSSLHGRILPNSIQAYAFALLCVAIATGLEFALLRLDNGISPMGSYYPAILFAALVGGIGPGVLAATLGGLIAWWAIIAPQFSFAIFQYGDKITLVTYALASMLMVWGADYFRRLSKRLEDEETFRKLAVEELAHRLKNKIATIQAIISIQLREHPQIRDDLLGRLMALTATDALIEEAQSQGAHILDIARAELGPYVASRSTIQGVNVLLPPNYALTIALLVHELATNSAKYGALSAAEGRVSVRSSVSGAVLSIGWSESNGPAVTAPTREGFGLRLLQRALDQFGGHVDVRFEPTGLICGMSMPLSEGSAAAAPEIGGTQVLTAQSPAQH
jgi:two-component sensor histidine kinase